MLFSIFAAVFIAELGDKTQLATMLFAADREVSKWTVFLGASLALIVASGIGVLAGSACSPSSVDGSAPQPNNRMARLARVPLDTLNRRGAKP